MPTKLPAKMYAVTRDGEIYLIRPTLALAKREGRILSSGSKHEWGIMVVRVTRWQSFRQTLT